MSFAAAASDATSIPSMTITEFLSELISLDNASLTMQLLSVLRQANELIPMRAATITHAPVTSIAKTIKSLIGINNQSSDGGELSIDMDSIVLVTAAKHGYGDVVEAGLANNNVHFPEAIKTKACNEANNNKHVAIVQRLHLCISAAGDGTPHLISNVKGDQHATVDTCVSCVVPKLSNRTGNVEAAGYDVEGANTIVNENSTIGLTIAQLHATFSKAITKGLTNTVKSLLLNPRSDPAAQQNAAIARASHFGHLDIVRLLLSDLRVNPGARENLAIGRACTNGHTSIVRLLMSDLRVDPATQNDRPIQTASQNGHTDIVRMLLSDPRVNPAALDNSAIWQASLNGHTDTMRLLLSDPRVNPSPQKCSAICAASKNGHTSIVQLLLSDHRVNPSSPKCSALSRASQHGHIDTVRLLLSDPRFDPGVRENSPIGNACANGHTSIVRLLLSDPRANPAAQDNKPIRMACKNGHIDIVQLLLSDPRVNPAAENNWAICTASENGHTSTVELLMSDPRVNPAALDNSAICAASQSGHTTTIQLLLSDPRVNPATQENAAIRFASKNGHISAVKLLLTDPRVNPAALENLPVSNACQSGHVDVVRLLLLDPRVDPTGQGNRAIALAIALGHTSTVKLLLSDRRVNPAAQNNRYIRVASRGGHTEVVKLLLSDTRVNPSAHDNWAFRETIRSGFPETMSALLQDPRVTFTEHDTAGGILVAIAHGFVDVVSILMTRFPLGSKSTTTLIPSCVQSGRTEIFKIIFEHMKTNCSEKLLSTSMHEALENACKHGRHEIVLELLAQSKHLGAAKIVEKALSEDELVAKLACMHVDVLRVVLTKVSDEVKQKVAGKFLSAACRTGSVGVVRELVDKHRDTFGDWTVDDFNVASLWGNVKVLQLLSLSRYGGCEKLAQEKPLNRICTRRVLGEMYVQSSFVLMWCAKKRTTARAMARLLDVLRDLVTDGLLKYEMK